VRVNEDRAQKCGRVDVREESEERQTTIVYRFGRPRRDSLGRDSLGRHRCDPLGRDPLALEARVTRKRASPPPILQPTFPTRCFNIRLGVVLARWGVFVQHGLGLARARTTRCLGHVRLGVGIGIGFRHAFGEGGILSYV
jgi:hypothetical protein